MRAFSPNRTLLGIAFATAAFALAATPTAAEAETSGDSAAARVASIATVTTRDFRIAVVVTRLTAGAIPTADVRVGIGVRSDGSWREKGETRLTGAYFWRTVTGPRAICKLDVVTAGGQGRRPNVSIRVLQSPSLGCGPRHRIPLASR